MTALRRRLLIATASALALPLAAQAAAADRPGPKLAPVYAAARAALRASGVPALLPVPLPSVLGPIRSVAVIDAGATGYYVGFSSVVGCAGALSCASFHAAGSVRPPPDRGATAGVSIALPDGSRGRYRPEDCSGSSCTEASLTFSRGKYAYELDVKSGTNDRAVLLEAYRHLRPVR